MVPKLSVFVFLAIQGVFGEDLPCMKREMEYGFVCVCNSSYCDTVERPPRLSQDQYYLYVTGQLSPGFSRSTGTFLHSDSQSSGIVFNIDSSVQYQEIIGFGGSFTDSVGIVFNSLPQGAQDKFIESYFSENGLEYSAGRVVLAGSDFSTRIYTYDDSPDDPELSHFALQQEDFLYKIPLIHKAMNSSPHTLRLVATPFSAPPWMKTNGLYSSSYIKKQHLDTWAKYIIKFLDAYAEQGIQFWLLTESNEVAMPYTVGPLPLGNLGWPVSDRYFVKNHLGPQLRSSNHSNVKYAPLDDQRPFVTYWMKKFTVDPEVSELVAGVTIHWYWDWIFPVEVLDALHHDYPDKLIIYSESSINVFMFGGQFVMLGDWYRGSMYLYNMIDNLNHWTNAYLDWNLALNLEGGPELGIQIDSPIIVNATSGEFYKNPMFYAMGTFSKFIPPGAFRVNVTSNLNHTERTEEERELLRRHYIQLMKGVEEEEGPTPAPLPTFPPFPQPTVPKTIHCLATVNPDQSTTVILYNAMDEQAEVSVVDATVGTIVTSIPSQTVHTFIYWPKQNQG